MGYRVGGSTLSNGMMAKGIVFVNRTYVEDGFGRHQLYW